MVAGSLKLCGVNLIETRLEPSTIRDSEALIVPSFATMFAVPEDCPVTLPETPTVATLVSEEDQVAYTFTFCTLPSLHFPFALKGMLDPGANIGSGLAVDTVIEVSVAELTVTGVLPLWLTDAKLKVALALALP